MSFVRRWNNQESIHKALHQTQTRLEQYRTSLRLAGTEIERRNKAMRAVTAFTYQASRLTEPAALLKLALVQALQMTGNQAGAIILIAPETKQLYLGTHQSLSKLLVRILTGGHVGDGATALMPHLVSGEGALLELSDSASEEEQTLLTAVGLSSLVSLPLYAGPQLLGALVVGSQRKATFSQANLIYLVGLSQATAVTLESLRLREKLWHMAETLLSKQVIPDLMSSTDYAPEAALPPLPPLQAKLANTVATLGCNMAAVFAIDSVKSETWITLIADYGLSPIFTGAFARFQLTERFFPFNRLAKSNLLIPDITKVTTLIPMLISLQEEGARALAAIQLENQDQTKIVLLVAATEPESLTTTHLNKLTASAKTILPLLTPFPQIPTLSARSIHVPTLSREATDDDLEQLLAAIMAAEEEVERHNADFAALTAISKTLNHTLNLNEILEKALGQINDLLQTEAAWLYLIEDPNQHPVLLKLHAYHGLSDRYVQGMRQLSLGDGFEGTVAKEKKAWYVDDVTKQPLHCHLLLELEQIQAVASVPLISAERMEDEDNGRVIGVLSVAMHHIHPWQSRQIRLLTTIANQMALSVNNAQLYAQVNDGMILFSTSNQILQEMNKHLMENQSSLQTKLASIQAQEPDQA